MKRGVIALGVVVACGRGAPDSASDSGDSGPEEPAGPWRHVSAATVSTCGLRADGTVACWGGDLFGQASPPGGAFEDISSALRVTCGLRPGGALECWGDAALADPPEGTFAAVSVAALHACALRTDGSLVCWGRDDDGEATPPPGPWRAVAAGDGGFTCGIDHGGSLACWGPRRRRAHDPAGRRLGLGRSRPGPRLRGGALRGGRLLGSRHGGSGVRTRGRGARGGDGRRHAQLRHRRRRPGAVLGRRGSDGLRAGAGSGRGGSWR